MIPSGAGLISSCSWFLYCGDPHPADGSLKSLQRRPPTRGADADFQERLNDIGNRYVTGGYSLSFQTVRRHDAPIRTLATFLV
jgi:hypothetical protein